MDDGQTLKLVYAPSQREFVGGSIRPFFNGNSFLSEFPFFSTLKKVSSKYTLMQGYLQLFAFPIFMLFRAPFF